MCVYQDPLKILYPFIQESYFKSSWENNQRFDQIFKYKDVYTA